MPGPSTQQIDQTLIMAGYQGELFDGQGNLIATVNTFHASVAITNSDYQPAGQALQVAILQSYKVTLTFQETIIDDLKFLKQISLDLGARKQSSFAFQCQLFRPDGQYSKYLFNNVVPDGNIDLANVAPGDTLKRDWTWRVNSPPVMDKLLGTGA